MRRGWMAVAAATMVVLTACSSGGGSSSSAVASGDPAKVSGEITVLTNRTDLIKDGVMKHYAAEFNKLYPNVKVKFEGLTDYEGETKIRMNTENYGDVLLIPNTITLSQFPNFFAPLGKADDLSKKYDYIDYAAVGDQAYGIASMAVASGFVYNKALWAKAGITEWPTTPEQFVTDLKAIKEKTGATPYYTNYKDAWPLQKWTDAIGAPSCDVNTRDRLASDKAPWTAGKDLYAIDNLVYTTVHEKLTEDDPTTTNWENSKTLLGTGKVGAMYLGSWALPQMQKAAKDAGQNPDDIAFMPFPAQAGGHSCTIVSPDYRLAVNKHSKSKEAARAWLDWYIDKSGAAQDAEGISVLKGAPMPAGLKPLEEKGVRFIPQAQTKSSEVSKIGKASEVGLDAPDYRQHLVDIARGAAPGDANSYFADLNKKWAEAVQNIG